MMELLDSLVFLQVECEKYMFLDKHRIIFGIKMQDQVFSNSNREMGFGTRDELRLWDHARLQRCIREFL